MKPWGIRTDTEHNTPYIWRELEARRLRQGWGRRPEEDLEVIASRLAAGAPLAKLGYRNVDESVKFVTPPP